MEHPYTIQVYGPGASDFRMILNQATRDSIARVKRVFTRDRVDRPTVDTMPSPGDEEFPRKLNEHFRKEARAILATDPEEMSKSSRDYFAELQKLLDDRKDVLKVHERFRSAKRDIERYTDTTDSRSRHPFFLNHQSRKPWNVGGKPPPSAAELNAAARKHWGRE